MALDQKESIVAFIDVLGFGEMVKNNMERVEIYFDRVEREIARQTKNNRHIEISHLIFSDSVVLASPLVPENEIDRLCAFLIAVKNIQFELATDGIWIRGGIAIDKLHIDMNKSRVAGIGMNKAYQLEKLAEYPRIILDSGILNRFSVQKKEFLQKVNGRVGVEHWAQDLVFERPDSFISEFPVDAFHVDYLSCFKWKDKGQIEKILKFAGQLREHCYGDQAHFLKYRWLIDYAQMASMRSPHSEVRNLFWDI